MTKQLYAVNDGFVWVIDWGKCVYKYSYYSSPTTEIGKKAGLCAKLQPGRARKRINAT